MIYKKFKKFLEEVDLTSYTGGEPSNPGLPKEFFSSLNEPSKSKSVSGYAASELTYKGLENKKDEINTSLEEVAKEVIKEYYSDFFTQKNISLDVKISSGVDIQNFYDQNKTVKEADFDYIKNLKDDDIEDIDEINDIEQVDDYNDEVIDDEEFDDDDIKFDESLVNENKLTKLAIHKMKLINNIVQGEGLNTKALINLPSTKDKLINLYKKYESETSATNRVISLIQIWNDFANHMKRVDWERGDIARPNSIPFGSAYGACAVDIGQDKPKLGYNNPSSTQDEDDIVFESLILESNKPQITIKSRGIDFAMLLHETVKGVYSLAYSNAFKDEDLVKKLAIATGGIADETQDFKYGPIIAEDLMNFVNDSIDKNKNNIEIEKYASIRLYTYRFLCELESEEFLKVFKGILYKATKLRLEKRHKNKDFVISEDTEDYILYSENKVDNIVNQVISKLINKENKKQEKENRKREWDEYQRQLKEWEEYEKNKKTSSTSKIEVEEVEEEDRTNWTKNDYNDAINIALENDDIPRLTLLSNEMRSKKMYENVYTNFKIFKKLI